MEESGNLQDQVFQKIGLFRFQHRDLYHPEPGLVGIYLYKAFLVVAAQDKLAKELHLPFILALGLQLVDISGAEIFDTFGEFLFIEQDLINAYKQFVRPIGIKLAAKTVVSKVGQVVLKDFLEPF